MRRLEVFVVAFLFWCLLAWPYSTSYGWDWQSIAVGLGASALTALVFGNVMAVRPSMLLDPVRWFWFIIYVPVFLYYCVKANLQVVYLVLHPKMPIRPGIVKVHTGLKSEVGVTALANSITLTPGTLTVDAGGGDIYVHWISVEAPDEEGATNAISARFERFLKRIIE